MRLVAALSLALCARSSIDVDVVPALDITGPSEVYGARTVTFAVAVSDADGDPVTLEVEPDRGTTATSEAAIAFTAPRDYRGPVDIRVIARDSRGGTTEKHVTIEVVVLGSCLAIRDGTLNDGSAAYELVAGDQFFDAYCDMDADGGGWTLIAKVPGLDARFEHDARLWTAETVTPISDGVLDLRPDAALWSPAAGLVPVGELTVAFDTANGMTRHVMPVTGGAANAVALLGGAQQVTETNARAVWLGLVGGVAPSLQQFCNRAGFALGANQAVRVGLQANETNDCLSPDSAIGIGLQISPPQRAVVSGVMGCNPANSCADNPAPQLSVFGFLLVR